MSPEGIETSVQRLDVGGGRIELEELASRYAKASGKLTRPGTSPITYILVHEREQGLIRN